MVIVDDVLELSKGQEEIKFEKIPFSLREIMELVYDTFYLKAEEKGIALKSDVNADVPETLVGDPDRLNQFH